MHPIDRWWLIFLNYETATCCVATPQSLLLHETVLIQEAVELMISRAVSVTLLEHKRALHHYLARSVTEMQTKAVALFLSLKGTTSVSRKAFAYHGLPLKKKSVSVKENKGGSSGSCTSPRRLLCVKECLAGDLRRRRPCRTPAVPPVTHTVAGWKHTFLLKRRS